MICVSPVVSKNLLVQTPPSEIASYITTAKKKKQDGRQFSKKTLKIILEEFNGIFHRLQRQLVPMSLLLASICCIIVNHSKTFIINIVSCSLLLVSVHHSLTTVVGHYSG